MCENCGVLEDDGMIHFSKRGKAKTFFIQLGEGLFWNFPICCILRYSLELAWYDGKVVPEEKGPAALRGIVRREINEEPDVFVPCNIFHHKTEDID